MIVYTRWSLEGQASLHVCVGSHEYAHAVVHEYQLSSFPEMC
jgi:hypothetical protein